MTPLLTNQIQMFAERYSLTPRERNIVSLLVDGFSSARDIAACLNLSTHTVYNHFKSLFRRTNTNSQAGLMSLFIRESIAALGHTEPEAI